MKPLKYFQWGGRILSFVPPAESLPTLTAMVMLCLIGVRAAAQDYSVLHNFIGSDGANPEAGLILSDGVLYGTTYSGGSSNLGTVFKINTNGTGYTVLKNFTGLNGQYPQAGLLLSGAALYGTTYKGGTNIYYPTVTYGTLFKVNLDGSGFTVIMSFSPYDTDGNYPAASLVLDGSTLYGTTAGIFGSGGAVYKLNTNGTGYTKLAGFRGNVYSSCAPVVLSGTNLYGTSAYQGSGKVFRLSTNGSGFTVLTNISGDSYGGLVLSGTNLYGTSIHYGTVFRLNTDGTGYTVLKNFSNSRDFNPRGDLLLYGGTLYGTTQLGGAFNSGTVFALNTDGSEFTTLKEFRGGSDGAQPYAGLVLSGTTLYGTTMSGGTSNYGVIFSLPLSPVIVSAPSNQIVMIGRDTDFEVNATGMRLAYQWFYNGTNALSGGTNSVLSLTNIQSSQSGIYTVVITNNFGSVTSAPALLTAAPAPPTIITQPRSHAAPVGFTADFYVITSGALPMAYQWKLNQTNTASAGTNYNLHLANIQPSDAGSYTVTVTNAFGAVTSAPATLSIQSSTVVTNNSETALRSALAAGGLITFSGDGAIPLASTITIAAATVLDGNGYDVTISGGNAVRVFYVNTNVSFQVMNLTIANGLAQNGAGIFNAGGNVILQNVVFEANTASSVTTPPEGGAIFNRGGVVTATDCLFSGNLSAQQFYYATYLPAIQARGGAIRNESGQVTIERSMFMDNSTVGADASNNSSTNGFPGYAGCGGAIHNSGTFFAGHCTFRNNSTGGGRGGLGGTPDAGSSLSPPPPAYAGGNGGVAAGGAMWNQGALMVDSCTFVSNSVFGGTGGAGGWGADGCSVGGQYGGNGGSGAIGGAGIGSAIFNNGIASILNSTFKSDASAGGGGGLGGPGAAPHCTGHTSGGSGGNGGSGGLGAGGIYNTDVIGLTNCTVASELGIAGAGGGAGAAGIGTHDSGQPGAPGSIGIAGGGIAGGGIKLFNTILASSIPANCSGTINDASHNISSDASCTFTGPGSMNNTDPQLGPLADNGGPTLTMALLPGSPAINAGASVGAPTTDQRGVTRPQGAGVDMGAFEYQSVPMFSSAEFQTPTDFRLQMSGLLPNQAYTLQTSSNLLNWSDLATCVADTNGVCEYVDCDQGNNKARFYRLKSATP